MNIEGLKTAWLFFQPFRWNFIRSKKKGKIAIEFFHDGSNKDINKNVVNIQADDCQNGYFKVLYYNFQPDK